MIGSASPPTLPEPRSGSACAQCRTARCCAHYTIDVTGHDVWRLMRGLGLAPWDFLAITAIDSSLAGDQAIFFGDDRRAYVLRLARTRRAHGPGGKHRCGFLMHVADGVERCGAYAWRPMACRVFPARRGPNGGVALVDTSGVCPPHAWSIARTDIPASRLLLRREDVERAIYRAAVARWNRASHQVDAAPGAERRAAHRRFVDALVGLHRAIAPWFDPILDDAARFAALSALWRAPDVAPAPPFELVGTDAEAAIVARHGDVWTPMPRLRAALDAAFGPWLTATPYAPTPAAEPRSGADDSRVARSALRSDRAHGGG